VGKKGGRTRLKNVAVEENSSQKGGKGQGRGGGKHRSKIRIGGFTGTGGRFGKKMRIFEGGGGGGSHHNSKL